MERELGEVSDGPTPLQISDLLAEFTPDDGSFERPSNDSNSLWHVSESLKHSRGQEQAQVQWELQQLAGSSASASQPSSGHPESREPIGASNLASAIMACDPVTQHHLLSALLKDQQLPPSLRHPQSAPPTPYPFHPTGGTSHEMSAPSSARPYVTPGSASTYGSIRQDYRDAIFTPLISPAGTPMSSVYSMQATSAAGSCPPSLNLYPQDPPVSHSGMLAAHPGSYGPPPQGALAPEAFSPLTSPYLHPDGRETADPHGVTLSPGLTADTMQVLNLLQNQFSINHQQQQQQPHPGYPITTQSHPNANLSHQQKRSSPPSEEEQQKLDSVSGPIRRSSTAGSLSSIPSSSPIGPVPSSKSGPRDWRQSRAGQPSSNSGRQVRSPRKNDPASSVPSPIFTLDPGLSPAMSTSGSAFPTPAISATSASGTGTSMTIRSGSNDSPSPVDLSSASQQGQQPLVQPDKVPNGGGGAKPNSNSVQPLTPAELMKLPSHLVFDSGLGKHVEVVPSDSAQSNQPEKPNASETEELKALRNQNSRNGTTSQERSPVVDSNPSKLTRGKRVKIVEASTSKTQPLKRLKPSTPAEQPRETTDRRKSSRLQQELTVVKKKMQIQDDDGDGEPEEKRSSHKAAEQRRRDSLKVCFDDLRKILPPISTIVSAEEDELRPGEGNVGGQRSGITDPTNPNKAISKVQLLRRSNEYILSLHNKLERRDRAIQLLKNHIHEIKDRTGDSLPLTGFEFGDLDLGQEVDDDDIDGEGDDDVMETDA